MNLFEIWAEIVNDNLPHEMMNSPLLQFGTARRSYLGATLLPDKIVLDNSFVETKVTYKTFPALDGTRYSEPKMQGGQLVGSFQVTLGEIDTASQLTGHDIDTLVRIASTQKEVARTRLINWVRDSLAISLAEKEEIQRWEAIVDAQVTIRGMDGNNQVVALTNPAGHRVEIPSGTSGSPAGWYLSSYDIMADIAAMQSLLSDKGYEVRRIIGDRQVITAMATNATMQERLGNITIANGSLTARSGVADLASINSYLTGAWGLPPIEEYNATYATTTAEGRAFFKKRGTLVFLCTTGRDELIETGNDQEDGQVITDTLGYYALGRPVGQTESNRQSAFETQEKKPVGIYGQAYQTSFPVITEPQAIGVLTIPLPTAS